MLIWIGQLADLTNNLAIKVKESGFCWILTTHLFENLALSFDQNR